IAIGFMAAFGKATWGILFTTAAGISIMFSAENFADRMMGGEYTDCQLVASAPSEAPEIPDLAQTIQSLRQSYISRVRPILQEIKAIQNKAGGCTQAMIGVNDDILDDYRSIGCLNSQSDAEV